MILIQSEGDILRLNKEIDELKGGGGGENHVRGIRVFPNRFICANKNKANILLEPNDAWR